MTELHGEFTSGRDHHFLHEQADFLRASRLVMDLEDWWDLHRYLFLSHPLLESDSTSWLLMLHLLRFTSMYPASVSVSIVVDGPVN